MDQEFIQTPPSPPSPPSPPPPPPIQEKESDWKNILTIVFLVIVPIIGVILMWFLVDWSKKTKIIITVALGILPALAIIGILASIVLVSMSGARERANDARVMADMGQIRISAEIAYDQEQSYGAVSCNHPEIAALCDDIREQAKKEPTIYSSQADYCAFIKLSSEKYYCADNSLRIGETSIYPGGAGYCNGTTFVCPR